PGTVRSPWHIRAGGRPAFVDALDLREDFRPARASAPRGFRSSLSWHLDLHNDGFGPAVKRAPGTAFRKISSPVEDRAMHSFSPPDCAADTPDEKSASAGFHNTRASRRAAV